MPRNKMIASPDGGFPAALTAEQEAVFDADEAAVLAAVLPRLLLAVKVEAGRRIEAIVGPDWKQRNLLAQGTELAMKGQGSWTQAETDAWTAGQALWDQVKTLRATSDALEATVQAMTDAELAAFDPTDDVHWPA